MTGFSLHTRVQDSLPGFTLQLLFHCTSVCLGGSQVMATINLILFFQKQLQFSHLGIIFLLATQTTNLTVKTGFRQCNFEEAKEVLVLEDFNISFSLSHIQDVFNPPSIQQSCLLNITEIFLSLCTLKSSSHPFIKKLKSLVVGLQSKSGTV